MTRFLLKLAFFLLTSFVVINIVAAIYGPFSRSHYERDGSETFESVRRARTPSTFTNVVLGDSVCHQLLLQNTPPDTLNLSCNQAISMCGQFLLARAAVAHDPFVKRITLAYIPGSFSNDLNQKFTFNYVVKPFYIHADMRDGMDALVHQRLDRRPLYRLMVFPMFRYSDLLNGTDYSGATGSTFSAISPVSIDYLHQLVELCDSHHIRLRIVSPPISQDSGSNISVFLGDVSAAQLDNAFTGYPASIRRVPPDLLIDDIHFKAANIPQYAADFVKMLRE
jgi:hypothetical protein